jgi:hypothetical protein
LLQFITSFFISRIWLKPAWLTLGDVEATLFKIADTPWLLQANILADMLTTLVIIFLGAVLYITLRHLNEKVALTVSGRLGQKMDLALKNQISALSLGP